MDELSNSGGQSSVFSERTAEEARCAAEELAAFLGNAISRSDGADFTQRFRQESESILCWCRDNDWILSSEKFADKVGGMENLDGGNEHVVYYDTRTNRIVKITLCPPNFGAQGRAQDYIQNFLAANFLFGDDIRLEGLVNSDMGLRLVVSQPFIKGVTASLPEIETYFSGAGGFIPFQLHAFKQPEAGLLVMDARPANVLKDEQGFVYPIDLQILWPGHDLSELWS